MLIPIVHTLTDMGTLGPAIQRAKLAKFGRHGLTRATSKVEKIWDEIERVVGILPLGPGTVRVYQDGLPVCGHEQKIVSKLAEAGSRNHRLLVSLEARGAVLMGTESGELLVEEHQLANAAFAPGRPAASRSRLAPRPARMPDTLLERRDRYIAHRINSTLGPGETGILFLGMLHDVKRYLDADILITNPLVKDLPILPADPRS